MIATSVEGFVRCASGSLWSLILAYGARGIIGSSRRKRCHGYVFTWFSSSSTIFPSLCINHSTIRRQRHCNHSSGLIAEKFDNNEGILSSTSSVLLGFLRRQSKISYPRPSTSRKYKQPYLLAFEQAHSPLAWQDFPGR
jgi:hypothetical protein